MCHFLPVHHFGKACFAGSKVNIQHQGLAKDLKKAGEHESNNDTNRYWDSMNIPVESDLELRSWMGQ